MCVNENENIFQICSKHTWRDWALQALTLGGSAPQTPPIPVGLRHAEGRRPGAVAQQIEDFQRSKEASKAKKQSKEAKQRSKAKKQSKEAKQNKAKQVS